MPGSLLARQEVVAHLLLLLSPKHLSAPIMVAAPAMNVVVQQAAHTQM
jgi:hypothetical protein